MMNTIKKRLRILIVVSGVLIAGFAFVFISSGSDKLGYTVFSVDEGWGYAITVDDKTVIHQPFIPAISGHRPFPDSQTAASTARLVVRKLKNRDTPALSEDEINRILKQTVR